MEQDTLEVKATKARPGRGAWAKFALVFVLAVVIGALVVANWRDRVFSLVVANVQIKAGIVILASVITGFILGLAFFWSASTRD